jgi:hypothetical protein
LLFQSLAINLAGCNPPSGRPSPTPSKTPPCRPGKALPGCRNRHGLAIQETSCGPLLEIHARQVFQQPIGRQQPGPACFLTQRLQVVQRHRLRQLEGAYRVRRRRLEVGHGTQREAQIDGNCRT